jgi:hypothetical protein
MLEPYRKALKALDIDIDKIMLDLVRPLVREDLARDLRMRMRKEMKRNEEISEKVEDSYMGLSNKTTHLVSTHHVI